MRSWLRPAVRRGLAGYRRVRHARQRLTRGVQRRRVVLRRWWKRARKAWKSGLAATSKWTQKAGGQIQRLTSNAVVLVRQPIYYRMAGERHDCPACGSRRIRHLRPLAYSQSIDHRCSVGFISGCAACGLLFANPFPTDDHFAEVYSLDGDYGRKYSEQDKEKPVSAARLTHMFAPIRDQLDVFAPAPDRAVLDFGCGRGGLLDVLARAGWTTYGVDPSTKVAFRRHREVVDIPDTPTFHLIMSRQVLEHVAAPLAILRSWARATHPSGFVVISVPNLDGLPEHGDRKYCLRSETHVLAYSSACLEYLLNTAGFDVVSVDALEGRRKMVVIGQRVDAAPMHRPLAPLAAALTALARYDARPGSGPTSGLPVRVQAAVWNWRRSWDGHRPRR